MKSGTQLLYKDEVYAIQGAVFEVYREVGSGFLEAVYQECLRREFANRAVPFREQATVSLAYKGTPLTQTYVADFVCYDSIIVEVKAVSETRPEHRAQVHNYLKATGLRLGLLVNFGHFPLATVERIVR